MFQVFLYSLVLMCSTHLTALDASAPVSLGSQFDAKIENAMQHWRIPGAAIGIIHKDKIIHARGYGVRRMDSPELVDVDSVFPIASNTKTFLATIVAQFVDQGLLDWDDPIIKHFPSFQVADAYATEHLTIRDILSHRAGFERTDLVWFLSDYNVDQLINQMKGLKLEKSFRSHSVYNNMLGIVVAKILEEKSGKTWENLLQKNIFDPLDMRSGYPDNHGLAGEDNIAHCHTEIQGELVRHDRLDYDNIKPTISINSSLRDLLKWVALHMNHGKVGDQVIVKSESIQECHKPQVLASNKSSDISFESWGLGWQVFIYQGKKVVCMSGCVSGGISNLVFLPEEEFGFVILTNKDSEFNRAAWRMIIDYYLDSKNSDRNRDQLPKKDVYTKDDAGTAANPFPCLALKEYEGIYENDLYGTVEIRLENNQLVVKSPTFKGRLSYFKSTVFNLRHVSPYIGETTSFTFNIAENGTIDSLLVKIPEKIFFTKVT